eukprot:TRINITY_DN774144_c0_g1_i1.p1 TRINITY_DN774144_c0_g1~~TRINITY_DN774144_c0_g1_i1.p1  ORF type:complete len:350 (-),score=102.66 TRINITY_DN774144_c0_g1_i1:197-1246(-)
MSIVSDDLFDFDEKKLEKIRKDKPWMQDSRYFKKVKVSASATMKMVMHAITGCEQGLKGARRTPIEIMGLIIGNPDVTEPGCMVVTDAFPLPVEGSETKVMADDDQVVNYMIQLSDQLELTRKECIMGWYHSHPFDVGVHSNAFMSGTDVSTQLMWQRMDDNKGRPWLAIVVDPLRTLAKGKPEMGAFRCLPVEDDNKKKLNPCGVPCKNEKLTVERWGNVWNRYHTMDVVYYTCNIAAKTLNDMSKKFMWTKMFTSTPQLERESRARFSERLGAVASEIKDANLARKKKKVSSLREQSEVSPTESAAETSSELAMEQLSYLIVQATKKRVFRDSLKNSVGEQDMDIQM